MGIEILKQPGFAPDAGIFNLPPNFDIKKWAAEWVGEGMVPFKMQRQSLPGANATADGWVPYKDETEGKNKGKFVKTTNGAGKVFVLMVRPKQLQQDINALLGNVSKKHITRELRGETVGGELAQDPGMLPESRLREAQSESPAVNEEIPLNEISTSEEHATAEIRT